MSIPDLANRIQQTEDLGKQRIDDARKNGQIQIKMAKEQANLEIKIIQAQAKQKLDKQLNYNNDILKKAEQELNEKVKVESSIIEQHVQNNLEEAIQLILNTVFDV